MSPTQALESVRILDGYMIWLLLAGFAVLAMVVWISRRWLAARPALTFHLGVVVCIGGFAVANALPNPFESQRLLIMTLFVALGFMMMSLAMRVEDPGRDLRATRRRIDRRLAIQERARVRTYEMLNALSERRMSERHRDLKRSKLLDDVLDGEDRANELQRKRERTDKQLDQL